MAAMNKISLAVLVVVIFCAYGVSKAQNGGTKLAAPISVGVFDEAKISVFRQSDLTTVNKAIAQVAQSKKLVAVFSGLSAWSAPGTKIMDVTNDVILKFQALGGKTVSLPITKNGLSPEQSEAASKAIRTLNHVVSAYSAGISYNDFKPRLVDARIDIDEQLRLIPPGQLHDEIELSLEGYEDGMTSFDKIVTLEYYSVLKTTVVQQLLKKYSIPLDFNDDGGEEFKKQQSVNQVIDPMIAAGKQHLANAEQLSKKKIPVELPYRAPNAQPNDLPYRAP